MCHYKILAHNQEGYLILCHSCRHYQLAFGTTAVTFEPRNFARFCRQVSHLEQNALCDGFETQKRIAVEIFCGCATLLLNYQELKKLHGLLSEAAFNEEVENLLEDLKLARE